MSRVNTTLLKLAKRHSLYDGAVTFIVLPYVTLRNNKANEEFKATIHTSDRSPLEQAFLAMEGFLLDMTFADGDLPPLPNSWRVYWQEAQACATMLERWEVFELIYGEHIPRDWWQAYSATRDTVYDAQETVDAPAEGETDPQS